MGAGTPAAVGSPILDSNAEATEASESAGEEDIVDDEWDEVFVQEMGGPPEVEPPARD